MENNISYKTLFKTKYNKHFYVNYKIIIIDKHLKIIKL